MRKGFKIALMRTKFFILENILAFRLHLIPRSSYLYKYQCINTLKNADIATCVP